MRACLHLLAEEGEPTTYERFLSANKEETRKWVPAKGRLRASPRSKQPEVVRARAQVAEARRSYEREGTAVSREELNSAKQQLFNNYDRIRGEEVLERVKRVETEHGEQRYKESWKVINEMSGRKRAREGQLAGCSPEERVTSWFTHFRDLLGTHPTVVRAEEEIPAVFTNCRWPLYSYRVCHSEVHTEARKKCWAGQYPPKKLKTAISTTSYWRSATRL